VPPTTPDEPAAATAPRRFGRRRRLRRPAEYAAVLAAPRERSLRAARHWLSMIATWTPDPAPAVRFGVTVGRRNARRAVDRALVKRVVREAARHAAASLEAACGARGVRLDVAFRLKAARTTPVRPAKQSRKAAQATKVAKAAAMPLSTTAWRRQLRVEAEALLARLARHLAERPA
jgi:ribonuclease P protein component